MALSIFAIAQWKALPAQAKAHSSALQGHWILNTEESIAPQGVVFAPFTLVIRESGDHLDFTQYNRNAEGDVVAFSHRSATDGISRALPGMPGAAAAFTRLPSGIIDAKLRFADGSLQNKICVLQSSLVRQVCLATITSPSGTTVFFKHVLDKVKPD